MPKRTLRKMMLDRRRALSSNEVVSASLEVQQRFLASSLFAMSGSIALYAPIHNEIDTSLVRYEAQSAGKQLFFPAVDDASMLFRRVDSEASMVCGAMGIMEPDGSCGICLPDEIDVIIVPGIAFDIHGQRIGYGKGYYDRTLHSLEGKGRLVAFCYDFQLVEEIVDESHDVQIDMIITEKRVIMPSQFINIGREVQH